MITIDTSVLEIKLRAEDVLYLKLARPKNFTFLPGQAAEIFLKKPNWFGIGRPFAITSSPSADYLEFLVKAYASQAGFVRELFHLQKGDAVALSKPFGSIHYEKEGLFVAGGIGIAPFLSIFRDLKEKEALGDNHLIFAVKTKADLLMLNELKMLLEDHLSVLLSHEEAEEFDYGFVDEQYLQQFPVDTYQNFYLCGPPPMMDAVEKLLTDSGVKKEKIIF